MVGAVRARRGHPLSLVWVLFTMIVSLSWLSAAPGLGAPAPVASLPGGACGGVYEPVADTFVDSNAPTNNYGGSRVLLAGRDICASGDCFQDALLQFELSDLPPGATIHSATLRLHPTQWAGETPFALQISNIANPWSESNVSWDSHPQLLTTYGVSDVSPASGPFDLDATNIVRDWVRGVPNNGLAVSAQRGSAPPFAVSFFSREVEPALRPQLSVECTEPAPTVTSTSPVTPPATPPAGALRFLDGEGDPIAGDEVWLLCYEGQEPGAPRASYTALTDESGHPVDPLPDGCNFLAALHLEHTQPASSDKRGHGPAYRVYATSWPTGTDTLLPASGDIYIREQWPLVLFDVLASLAWQPEPGSPFLASLRQGLRATSAYLYDLTDGYMALGPVTIETEGRRWNSADLRFLAANDYRPSAYVGGLVEKPVEYVPAGVPEGAIYAPANIFLGRYWDGQNASQGAWEHPEGFRTLAHEWAHYALFLYDEYTQSGGVESYCTCNDLPDVGVIGGACTNISPELAASAMAFHYTATEFWHASYEPPATCLGTFQWMVHQESDWETIARWYDIQGLGGSGLQPLVPHAVPLPGPAWNPVTGGTGIASDLFGLEPGFRLHVPVVQGGGATSPATSEPNVAIYIDETLNLPESPQSQVYLLKEAAGGEPRRILHQGKAIGAPSASGYVGNITLLGVTPQDRVRVFVERYATEEEPDRGGRYYFPPSPEEDRTPVDGMSLKATRQEWQASLDSSFILSEGQVSSITFYLVSEAPLLDPERPPVAQLCAMDEAIGCHSEWRVAMTREAGSMTTWRATFTPLAGESAMPRYVLFHVQAPGVGELIRWFQSAGGVGPAHGDAFAPVRDGMITIDAQGPLRSLAVTAEGATAAEGAISCNGVTIMPAASYDLLARPLPTELGGFVGTPLDLDILLPDGEESCDSASRDDVLPASVRLSFFYDPIELRNLGISPAQLLIFRWEQEEGWVAVSSRNSGESQHLHWLSSALVSRGGVYAIGWQR